MSDVPARLQPYVGVLGEGDAIRFFLAFGGAPVYLAEKPQANSSVAELVGHGKAAALAKELGSGHVDVPIPKAWIAQRLRASGVGVKEIARRLHVTQVTVRGYLRKTEGKPAAPPPPSRQMKLPF